MNPNNRSLHKKNTSQTKHELKRIKKEEEKRRASERITYLESISESLALPTDILAGAPVINITGRNALLIENYKKILEYSEGLIRVQTKLYYVSIEGTDLCISYYTKDEMKITGVFRSILFS